MTIPSSIDEQIAEQIADALAGHPMPYLADIATTGTSRDEIEAGVRAAIGGRNIVVVPPGGMQVTFAPVGADPDDPAVQWQHIGAVDGDVFEIHAYDQDEPIRKIYDWGPQEFSFTVTNPEPEAIAAIFGDLSHLSMGCYLSPHGWRERLVDAWSRVSCWLLSSHVWVSDGFDSRECERCGTWKRARR